MFPISQFSARLKEILSDADDIKNGLDEPSEDLDELNATFEDALFMLDSAEEDSEEEMLETFDDALSILSDLQIDYSEMPEMADVAERLDKIIQMARANLKEN